jgi:hypothetical protein
LKKALRQIKANWMKMETKSPSNATPTLENTSLLPLITLCIHRGRMLKEKRREYHIERLLKS